MKRAILSASGTAGHLFPAESLAESLPGWEILFVAGGLKTNKYFNREAFPFAEISCSPLSGKDPFQFVQGLSKITSGICKSLKILKDFDPAVVIGFGSYYTLPVLAAATLLRKPIVIHEQNAVPGRVNRLFAPLAHTMAFTFPMTFSYLTGKASQKAVEVIFPQKKQPPATPQEAWEYFGMQPCGKPLLLVFGGSQGAARLNEIVLSALPHLPPVQILHFTGSEERACVVRQKYYEMSCTACVKAFEPRMDLAMLIADCAITRAGAATTCELIRHNLPAILVPFPFASENHQEKNAAHFVSIAKGGKMHKEKEINGKLLAISIVEQLEHCASLRENLRAYNASRNPIQLADVIKGLA